jgi:integrase
MIEYYAIFLLDKENGKPDAKVRYRVKWGKECQSAFSLGYRVDVDKWVTASQTCKANTSHGKKKTPASIINKKISAFSSATIDIFRNYEVIGRDPTEEEFRLAFNKAIGKTDGEAESSTAFFDAFDKFVKTESISKSWTENTLIKFNTIRRHLEAFDSRITFDKLSNEYLTSLMDYFLNTRNMRNTTTKKDLNLIVWFIRWASREGYYSGSVHQTFRPRLKGTSGNVNEVLHLTWEELIMLYNFEFESEKLDRVRDVFCFCCFTSLRYSDVYKLTKEDVKPDHIVIVTRKDVDGLKIELNMYSRAILEKYRSMVLDGNRALPVISNQKMNDALKEMAKAVGLNEKIKVVTFKSNQRIEEVFKKWQLITTHCGRRTFIVNSLFLGIPAEVVMKWTGHADFKAMKPYIRIVDQLKSEQMDKFNQYEWQRAERGGKKRLSKLRLLNRK